MDTDTLVEDQIEDGRKLIDLLAQKDLDVTAACWVKTSEEGRWFFYITSKLVEEEGLAAAYRKVYGVLQLIESTWVSMSDVKLIGRGNPIAKDVLDIYRRYPARIPTRYRRPELGDVAIEEAYIYPKPEPYIRGFDEIKKRFPSAEMLWVTVTNSPSLLSTVNPYIGKINELEFERKAPETLMFMGANWSSREPLARLGFVYRPEGWNTLFNPASQAWEVVVHINTNKKLYETMDFSPLVGLNATA